MSKFSLREALAAGTVSGMDTGRREQIEYIDIARLGDDERNFYELSGLDELAANIELIGLQQPIRVRPAKEAGYYIIVSGHRRRAAIRKLVDEGRDDLRKIPCIVEQGQESEAWQELRLILANSDTRRMTNAEIAKQAENTYRLLYQLKEEGVEFPGRMRDHVAEACQISRSKLARLEVIGKRLHPIFKPLWDKGELKETTAYALAQLPDDQQHKIFCRQNNASGKFEYLYENDVKRAAEHLDAIAALTCKKQDGGPCTNREGKWAHIANKPYYYGTCHKTCCADCAELGKCKYACTLLHDRVRQLKADAKAQKEQEAAALAERDRPAIEQITRLWKRFGEARGAARKSVKDVYAAARMMWAKSDDDKHAAMEKGTAKIAASSSLPYGYSLRLHEVQNLIALADLLGVSLDYLLCRTDEPHAAETQQNTPERCEFETWADALYEEPAVSGLYWVITGPLSGGGKLYWWNAAEHQWEHPATKCSLTVNAKAWMPCPELPEGLRWNREELG